MSITVAVSATDWPVGILRGYWAQHPMVTSVVSGFLLLGLAAFVVEELVREWEARRWRRVAAISYMSMGHLASKMFLGIEFLLTGTETWISPLPSHVRSRLRAIVTADETIGNQSTTRRLEELLRDGEWLKLTRDVLAALKFEHRDALARWIPSTLADARLTRAIEHLADVDMTRDALEGSIIRLIKFEDPAYEDHQPPAPDRAIEASEALRLWGELELELVATQEAFMRAAGNQGWTNDHGRRRLGAERARELDAAILRVEKRLR